MKCEQLIQLIERQFPPDCACEWDNVGLLVGDGRQEIQKVYLALDATDAAVEEAIHAGADLILTHHPLIFGKLKRVVAQDFIGRRIIRMIQAGLCCYAMHTNYDICGMADLAARKLGLSDTRPLEVTGSNEHGSYGIGKVGRLEREMSIAALCEQIKNTFGLEHVILFGSPESFVHRAAVCPGSGKSNVAEALSAGAQVYITGDIDHHTGIDAVARGLAVIDAGHYGMEHIFIDDMAQYLQTNAPELAVETQGRADPFVIL